MADTWGSVPFSALDDERLDGDPGPARAFFALVMLTCDDHGLFEGDAQALARRLGCDRQWVEDGLADIEERGLVERYEAPGRRRKVGRVIGYHDFSGHIDRKAYPSQRTASLYPDQDGNIIPGKEGRKRKEQGSEPDGKRPASKPQERRKSGASDAQVGGKSGASKPQAPRKTEEKRGEEKRGDPRATHSEGGATSAPPQPSPPGSTDARAIGSPVAVASPPALGGAGEATPAVVKQPQPKPGRRETPQQVAAMARALLSNPTLSVEELRRVAGLPPDPEPEHEPVVDEPDWDALEAIARARSAPPLDTTWNAGDAR